MKENITKPTLILDPEKVKQNIQFMAEKAVRHGLKLSPHFKTHQSIDIGRWFQKAGVDAATVSSVSMAGYFIENGWDDVTIVFPLNIREIKEVTRLAEKSKLTVLIDSLETVESISTLLDYPVQALIEIDSGYHRTGVDATNFPAIQEILDAAGRSENLFFKGFYCHSGDTYRCKSRDEIETVHERTVSALKRLRREFSVQFPEMELSLGDTPSCSITENFEGIDEIRPGNFVFFDLMQLQLGSCMVDQIGIAMACPVVFKNQDRMEITIYGGGVHFSKEALVENGISHYGLLVEISENGWSAPKNSCYLKSISQEHGVMKVDEQTFKELSIGDVVGILPVHSCMTADLMGEYITLDGEKIDHMSGPKFRNPTHKR